MRRLPVFFVLDCSESMIGSNLEKVEEGLRKIVQELRSDPYALETVYLSIIAFAGVAKVITPLLDLVSFYPPKLPVGGGTSLGAALKVLMTEIDRSVVKRTANQKGDWNPLVYLFTDGKPTDRVDTAIQDWNKNYKNKATMVAVGFGLFADLTTLKQLTDETFTFEESKEGDFKKFVDWVSASVVVHSKSVGTGEGANEVTDVVRDILTKIDQPPPSSDLDCVAIVGRCQNTRRPYLMKYDRVPRKGYHEGTFDQPSFNTAGCFPITEDYFDWSDSATKKLKINTEKLVGTPGCPHCGNASAFAMCGCEQLMCVSGPGEATCPWCERQIEFSNEGSSSGGGGGGF